MLFNATFLCLFRQRLVIVGRNLEDQRNLWTSIVSRFGTLRYA